MSSENIVFGVDWNTVDKKYNWLAVDKDGAVYAYSVKPSGHSVSCWNYEDSVGGCDYRGRYNLYPVESWTTMLAERPKQESPKGHKHHKEMLQYAQDAAVHKEPWKLWEWRDDYFDWTTLSANPVWALCAEYRRKPQTVTITIPEDVAIAFTSLILVSDAGKAVSVAIQEALNKRYD